MASTPRFAHKSLPHTTASRHLANSGVCARSVVCVYANISAAAAAQKNKRAVNKHGWPRFSPDTWLSALRSAQPLDLISHQQRLIRVLAVSVLVCTSHQRTGPARELGSWQAPTASFSAAADYPWRDPPGRPHHFTFSCLEASWCSRPAGQMRPVGIL